MALRAQNKQTTSGQHFFLVSRHFGLDPRTQLVGIGVRVFGHGLQNLHLDVAAQLNVGSAAGHVRRNGHRARLACICNDLRLLLMLARVQNVMRNLGFLQFLAQELGLFDRGRTHQNGLALLMRFVDFAHHGCIFFRTRAINLIMLVLALDFPVGRHFNHTQPVNLGEFFCLSRGCARHAAQLVIQAEIVLEGHRCQRHVFRLDRHAFLGFNRLMQPVGQTTPGHHSAREFVNQNDFSAAHDIILVAGKQLVRAQTLIDMVHDSRAFRIIKRLLFRQNTFELQQPFQKFISFLCEGDVLGFLVQCEMLFRQARDQFVDGRVKF